MRRCVQRGFAGLAATVAVLLGTSPVASAERPRPPITAPPTGIPRATASPGSFVPINPARLLDTRTTVGPVAAGGTLSVPVLGRAGVPASGVTAVAVHVTVTRAIAPGNVTVYPAGGARPATSTVNFTAGQDASNTALVPVGTRGEISLGLNSTGSAHLVLDITGYIEAGDTGVDLAQDPGLFVPVQPLRLIDTRRAGSGFRIPPQGALSIVVKGLPAGVSGFAANVTATGADTAGNLRVGPLAAGSPQTSNLNFRSGQDVADLVVSRDLTIYNNSLGGTDVIVDLEGYFTGGNPSITGHGLVPNNSARILDTRGGAGPVGPGRSITVALSASLWNGARYARPPTGAALTVTAVGGTAAGNLTVAPAGTATATSTVNYQRGTTVAGVALIGASADGRVTITNHGAGSVQILLDQDASYVPGNVLVP